MLSVFKLASLAAIAFAAMTSAAPIDVAAGVAGTDVDVVLPIDVPAILERDAVVPSVAGILTGLTGQLTPIVGELDYLTGANVTIDAVEQVSAQVIAVVQTAVSELQALVGKPVDTILVTVDGTAELALGDLVALLSAVLGLIFHAVGHVLEIVNGRLELVGAIVQSLGPLCGAVFALLQIVLQLVGNVLGDVVSALGGVLVELSPILVKLGADSILQILNL